MEILRLLSKIRRLVNTARDFPPYNTDRTQRGNIIVSARGDVRSNRQARSVESRAIVRTRTSAIGSRWV
jgi:hypothetical protein